MNTSLQDLENLCIDRLEDAKVLCESERYDGAFYFSGYVVEIGLKKRICKTLDWDEFPPKGAKELTKLFKTHDLEVLLQLSGAEKKIRTELFADWSIVMEWSPDKRYASRTQTKESAQTMINASEKLLKNL